MAASTKATIGFVAQAQGLIELGLQWRDTPGDVAAAAHVPLPSAAVADGVLTVARGLGYERRDLAALFEVLAHLAGRPG